MKLRKISEIVQILPFTEYDILQIFRKSFPFTELGRIYELLPLKEMAAELASHFHCTTHHRQSESNYNEGSFGNQKQHYGLNRISARNRYSETLMLFFGIHLANAATLAARQLATEMKRKEKKRA